MRFLTSLTAGLLALVLLPGVGLAQWEVDNGVWGDGAKPATPPAPPAPQNWWDAPAPQNPAPAPAQQPPAPAPAQQNWGNAPSAQQNWGNAPSAQQNWGNAPSAQQDWGNAPSAQQDWGNAPAQQNPAPAPAAQQDWGDAPAASSPVFVERTSRTPDPEPEYESDSDTDEGTGLQLQLGLSVPISFSRTYTESLRKANYREVGFLADIVFGYRWKYAGIFVRQQLGGSLYFGDDYSYIFPAVYQDSIHREKHDSSFVGSTSAMIRIYGSLTSSDFFFGSICPGVAYHGNIDGAYKVLSGFQFAAGIGYEHAFSYGKALTVSLEYTLFYYPGSIGKEDYDLRIHSFAPTVSIGHTF